MKRALVLISFLASSAVAAFVLNQKVGFYFNTAFDPKTDRYRSTWLVSNVEGKPVFTKTYVLTLDQLAQFNRATYALTAVMRLGGGDIDIGNASLEEFLRVGNTIESNKISDIEFLRKYLELIQNQRPTDEDNSTKRTQDLKACVDTIYNYKASDSKK